MSRRLGFFLLALAGLASPPAEAEFRLRAFGHDIAITGTFPDGVLEVDGQAVHQDAYISVYEVGIVEGAGVVVGMSSTGGNACEGQPFVLSFPAGAPPRYEGLDGCNGFDWTIAPDAIHFEVTAYAGRNGQRWEWTPEHGLVDEGETVFTPDPTLGWAELRSGNPSHPAELFNYGAVVEQIDGLLGGDRDAFLEIVNGPGSGKIDGDTFVGTACFPHMCTVIECIIVADISERRVYLAWKPEDKPIVVRPPIAEWPPRARSALADWALTWP